MATTAKGRVLDYRESPNSKVGWYIFDAGTIVVDGLTQEQARAICEWMNKRQREIAE